MTQLVKKSKISYDGAEPIEKEALKNTGPYNFVFSNNVRDWYKSKKIKSNNN